MQFTYFFALQAQIKKCRWCRLTCSKQFVPRNSNAKCITSTKLWASWIFHFDGGHTYRHSRWLIFAYDGIIVLSNFVGNIQLEMYRNKQINENLFFHTMFKIGRDVYRSSWMPLSMYEWRRQIHAAKVVHKSIVFKPDTRIVRVAKIHAIKATIVRSFWPICMSHSGRPGGNRKPCSKGFSIPAKWT